jgi:hypothetical protein
MKVPRRRLLHLAAGAGRLRVPRSRAGQVCDPSTRQPDSAEPDRLPAQAPSRSSCERGPAVLRQFHLPGRKRTKPRRVVAKVEWHPGELIPRVGFIVTNMSRPAERVVAFYNKRGTCEQWIKEGKGAVKWTRLSCRTFAANAVRLQLHALAYNLGNFLRTLATQTIKDWSLTSLKS